MERGKIKKAVKEKNFGFITPDEGKDDVFFHATVLEEGVDFNDLHDGTDGSEATIVEFEQEASDKGPKATKVVIVK